MCHGQALFCEHSTVDRESRARGLNLSPALGVYYLADLIRLIGAKRSQVENWVRSGWLIPEGPSATEGGTGHHRTFSFANLVDVSIAVRLTRARIPLRGFPRAQAKTLRDFCPSLAHLENKTDGQLAQLLVDDWTEREWAEVLAGIPMTREEFLADYVARNRELAATWRAFFDPATRPDETFALMIRFDRNGHNVSWTTDLATYGVHDTALVINLTTIFAELEDATGDRWTVN